MAVIEHNEVARLDFGALEFRDRKPSLGLAAFDGSGAQKSQSMTAMASTSINNDGRTRSPRMVERAAGAGPKNSL